MHALRIPALIVLILIPNTTWRDWRVDAGPQMRALIGQSGIAVMTARTAEVGRISPQAGTLTLLAGARLGPTANTAHLDYPALPDNLGKALQAAGFALAPQDPATRAVLPANAPRGLIGMRFVALTEAGDIAAADPVIGRWQRAVRRSDGALIIASTNPSPAEYRALDRLTPALIWEPSSAPGLLDSPSTRRAGLLTNTDIAPTIAEIAGARLPGPCYGAAARIVPYSDPTVRLTAISDASRRQERDQRAVPYIALALACLVAVATWRRLVHPSRGCLALTALLPAIAIEMLALPGIGASVIVGAALLGAVAFGQRGSPRSSVVGTVAVAAVAAVYIAVDTALLHCANLSVSLLGYSPAEGARYYGLGDEAMGVLSGAAVILAGALAGLPKGRILGASLWLIVAALLGLPTLGAKAGGMLVALIGLTTYVVVGRTTMRGVRPRVVLLWALAAVAAGVAALVALGRTSGSHVSATVAQARTFGPAVLWSVITRKLGMDLHLVTHSVWMLTLASSVAGTWLLVRRAERMSAWPAECRRALHVGAVVVAACLVLNDAGVVASALCMLFVWSNAAAASPRRNDIRNEEDAAIGGEAT